MNTTDTDYGLNSHQLPNINKALNGDLQPSVLSLLPFFTESGCIINLDSTHIAARHAHMARVLQEGALQRLAIAAGGTGVIGVRAKPVFAALLLQEVEKWVN